MFEYFHICTHESNDVQTKEDTLTVTIQNQGQIDVLIRGATVLEIKSIRVIRYTPRKDSVQLKYDDTDPNHMYDHLATQYAYYDDPHHYYQDYSRFFEPGATKSNPLPESFYEIVFKNRVKWLVEPPLEYEVVMRVRYDKEFTKTFAPEDCDICQGNGWFVDIIDNSGFFKIDKGVMKVLQRVIKDVLTELFSSVLSLEYGTKIKKTVMMNARDDDELFDDVRLIINEVEARYIQRQALEYDKLPPDERLESLIAENIYRSPSNKRKIVLELRIITEEEDNTFGLRL